MGAEPIAGTRTFDWDGDAVVTVDQRRLPYEHRVLRLASVEQLIDAISTLAVRGAPALGIAGAFGVALSARRHTDPQAVRADARRIAGARPTAVNLGWGVARALARLPEGPDAVLAEALDLLEQDERVNRAASARAADLVLRLCPRRPLRILTHCNTGRLATGAWGTALGTVRQLAERGTVDLVVATETRPLLQGARLTAWELREAGIPHRVCVDSAAAALMAQGAVDCVVVGADRIAANGDVANKIGTYALAVAAARHDIPFLVVAPESTVDDSLPDGSGIVIEERDPAEVTVVNGTAVTPDGTLALNPAFDVTPSELVTAVVTERRVLPTAAPADRTRCPTAADLLVRTARELYQRGWMDGTAGNLSLRLDHEYALITASGRSKGELTPADTVRVSIRGGLPVHADDPVPSQDTLVHLTLYRTFPGCGAVVHAHPPHATAVATRSSRDGADIARFEKFEIIKGLGLPRPDRADVAVVHDGSDVPGIAAEVTGRFTAAPPDVPCALLLGHHGATTWGADLEQARNRLESLEWLCRVRLLLGP
jgi:S-methyl-5-thioribose-1-phosphate isomerase/methylthioribulose-1-phosphate dehydratase